MTNIDNNTENADWLKSRRLDIPGLETFVDIVKYFNVPQGQPSRNIAIRKIANDHPWVYSLKPEEVFQFEQAFMQPDEKPEEEEK